MKTDLNGTKNETEKDLSTEVNQTNENVIKFVNKPQVLIDEMQMLAFMNKLSLNIA